MLCEFVGFKRIAPHLDIGLDLSKEYEAALRISERGRYPACSTGEDCRELTYSVNYWQSLRGCGEKASAPLLLH